MPPDPAEGDDERPGPSADPLADLLFGLVALLIPILAVLIPALQVAAEAVPRPSAAAAADFVAPHLVLDGAAVRAVRLTAAGVVLPDDGAPVPLGRILDDPRLAAVAERARTGGAALVVLVEPDAQESAFLFEAVAASHGVARLVQVRVDPGCRFVRADALAAACRAAGHDAGGGR